MFKAVSMDPAPRPRGMAQRQSQSMLSEQEKPSRARAVISVLTAVIFPVPKRLISQEESRLEVMVPQETMMVTMLAQETGRLRSV